MSEVGDVVVAVPARDEEDALGACLDSLLLARAGLRAVRPAVGVEVVLVLDRCTDRSAAIAATRPVTVRCLDAGSVGAARSAAVQEGLGRVLRRGGRAETTWLAMTDADCVVPASWLAEHVALAERGVDLVVGTVEPTGDLDPGLLAAWHARHVLRDGHEHVHGANLGVRADAYVEAGGFSPLPLHEDVALVAAVRGSGRRWVSTDRTRVLTSGRRLGRVDGGFASYLADLERLGLPAGSG